MTSKPQVQPDERMLVAESIRLQQAVGFFGGITCALGSLARERPDLKALIAAEYTKWQELSVELLGAAEGLRPL
jgi:hypothetical protein